MIYNNEQLAEAATLISTSIIKVNLQIDELREAKSKFYQLENNLYHWSEGIKIIRYLGQSLLYLFGRNNSELRTPYLMEFIDKTFKAKGWNLANDNPYLYNQFKEFNVIFNTVRHLNKIQAKIDEIKKVLGAIEQVKMFKEITYQIWHWFLQKKFFENIEELANQLNILEEFFHWDGTN